MKVRVAVRDLRVDFEETTVLRSVDLEVPAGDCVQITGANGSGKSTLLRAIAGLIRPRSGAVSLVPGTVIGYAPDVPALYDMLTPHEQLTFVARMSGTSLDVGGLLERVGLAEQAKRFGRDLSLGQRRRLSLAMALALEPNTLLLDEPFNGLDPQGVHMVGTVVDEILRSGGCVLVVHHGETLSAATREFHLESGLVTQGSSNGIAGAAP